jgi:DNA-directed RNA polymerase subunit RPC12/RpoP
MIASTKPGALLEIRSGPQPGVWLVRASGVIDESFDWNQIVKSVRGITVFDFDGVARITSYGVREWMIAMGELQGSCFFVRCRPALVSQFNIVRNFAGRGQLVSFYAPYVCSSCGKEFELLMDRRYQRPIPVLALHEVKCPACGAIAEFDDIPETFFSYITNAPTLILPPLAESVIDIDAVSGRPSAQMRLKITKEVEGQVTALWLSGPLDKASYFKRIADGLEGNVVLVLSGVTSATVEGVMHFNVFTQLPGVRLYLARVPLHLVKAFEQAPAALGGATIVSVQLHARCSRCGHESDLDADADLLRRSAASEIAGRCPVCVAPLEGPPPADLRDIMRLPLGDASSDVKAYLLHAQQPAYESVTLTMPSSSSTPEPPPSSSTRVLAPASTPSSRMPSSSRPGEPHEPPVRIKRYEVIRSIATGGMATVYLGRVVGAGGFERLVAIKVMHPHLAQDPALVAMFFDEARLAARIRHPNVVPTLDIDQTQNGLMMVMEYIEGASVRQLIGRSTAGPRKVPMPVVFRVMLDVLAGLHAAHELTEPDGTPLQIVHRDVSPHNLLIGIDGITRITDFGVAHAKSRIGAQTRYGEIKGKIGYMAPEQLRSSRVDRRSDLYSTGVVLWELLAGERLFKGSNEAEVFYSVTRGVTHSPTERNPAVPAEISAICMRALSEDPDGRYATAAVFAEQLEHTVRKTRVSIASTRDVAELVKQITKQV